MKFRSLVVIVVIFCSTIFHYDGWFWFRIFSKRAITNLLVIRLLPIQNPSTTWTPSDLQPQPQGVQIVQKVEGAAYFYCDLLKLHCWRLLKIRTPPSKTNKIARCRLSGTLVNSPQVDIESIASSLQKTKHPSVWSCTALTLPEMRKPR